MDKRASMVLVNIMIAVTVIITAIIFIDPLKDINDIGRTDLNCSSASGLTTGERMTCIVIDVNMPLFVGIVIGVGLAYIGARRLGVLGSDGG